MTCKELSRLYDLNREIEQDKQRLRELESASTNANSKITGMPHAPGISDKTSLAVDIAYLKGIIQSKLLQTVCEYTRLIDYINGIDDVHVRSILTLRHVNGLSWLQIGFSMGGGNTAAGVKRAYFRYLQKTCPRLSLEKNL